MANTTYIQFFLTDVSTRVWGDVAVVTCRENILTSVGDDTGDASGESLGEALGDTAQVCATNVFRRRGAGWRLWLHHGSPVLSVAGPPPAEPP